MKDSLARSIILGTGSFAAFVLVSTMFLKISFNIKDVGSEPQKQKVAGLTSEFMILDDSQKNSELKNKAGSSAVIGVDRKTKTLSFLSIPQSGNFKALARNAISSETAAANFNREYATYMGISNPDNDLFMIDNKIDQLGFTRIIYQQKFNNIPVFGAQTSVHLNINNEVITYEGNTVPNIQINTQPTLTADNALAFAIAGYEKANNTTIDRSKLVSSPELEILNKNLFINNSDTTSYLTWKVLIKVDQTVNEVYFVNASNGEILYVLPKIYTAVNRRIDDCSYGDGNCYYGQSLGSPAYIYGRDEGDPARGTTNQLNNPKNYPDTDTTYDYLGIIHNFYTTSFNRNGANNFGGIGDGVNFSSDKTTAYTFYNIVDNPPAPTPKLCPNAAYGGGAMAICYGFSKLDVIAHEYQHAVTEYSVSGVGLTYQDEPGILNEAFSDIFGIAVEFNELGHNDTDNPSSPAWLIGEGLDTADTEGNDFTRSLSTPSDYSYGVGLTYPDRFYSSSYYCGTQDYGGVHENLTVFGHAAYLMAMGGSFNGCSITGIGRTKMETILYRALNEHTLPSTDFNGMYQGVNTSCTEIIGNAGITSDDCLQVQKALQATEMDQPGKCSATARVTPICALPSYTSTPVVTASPTPVITNTPTPTPIVSVSTSVKLHYSTDNSGGIELAYVETVGNPASKSSGVTLTNGSSVIGTSISSGGDYSFYIKPQYYLSRVKRQTINVGSNNVTTDNVFEPGDLNNDDTVNVLDYSIFANNYYGTGVGDLNDDGIVNILDFSIFRSEYGKGGDYLTDYPSGWIW